jgi:hypothetical protein
VLPQVVIGHANYLDPLSFRAQQVPLSLFLVPKVLERHDLSEFIENRLDDGLPIVLAICDLILWDVKVGRDELSKGKNGTVL